MCPAKVMLEEQKKMNTGLYQIRDLSLTFKHLSYKHLFVLWVLWLIFGLVPSVFCEPDESSPSSLSWQIHLSVYEM